MLCKSQIQFNLCTTTTPATQKYLQLLTGGHCSEVIYAIKVQNRQLVVIQR